MRCRRGCACRCHDRFIAVAVWSNVAPADGHERHGTAVRPGVEALSRAEVVMFAVWFRREAGLLPAPQRYYWPRVPLPLRMPKR